jgi:hypothetical protein
LYGFVVQGVTGKSRQRGPAVSRGRAHRSNDRLRARIALAEGDRTATRRHLDLAAGQFADTLSPDHG